jgi:hypothetical protein
MGDFSYNDSSMANPFGDAFDCEKFDLEDCIVDYSNVNNSGVYINDGTYSKFPCVVPDHRSLD